MSEKHSRQSRFAGSPAPRYGKARGRYGESEAGRVISTGGCWCGKPMGHDWPGKDKGDPHPRENESG